MTTDSTDIFNVVLGTAGHIDHGKSSIVQRLTGIDPDRLPDEKRRGMTIDLGFAPLTLRDGRRIGIVDVPGHERFIKNMVAGSTGVDLVMLVIAADDGVMPQTREHLDIMTLLGLDVGLIVINKIDLVDSELVEVVELEVQELLQDTFLADAPMARVSATTGEGMDELTLLLEQTLDGLKPRSTEGVFRMPVQRVFSAPGFGTILTGIPLGGSINTGEMVEVLPQGLRGKIRGLQAYRQTCKVARAGHSTAINVADINYKLVQRGNVVATPGYFEGSTLVEARLEHLSTMRRPLRSQTTVRLHTGTSEALGKVVLLEDDLLLPGDSALCQLRLEEPVVVGPGDRFILRLHSPMITIGGGTIVGTSRHRLKARRRRVVDRLSIKEEALEHPELQVSKTIESSGLDPVRLSELVRHVKLPLDELKAMTEELCAEGQLVLVSTGGREHAYIASGPFSNAIERIQESTALCHQEQPLREWVDRSTLRARCRMEDTVFDAALAHAIDKGGLVAGAPPQTLSSGKPRAEKRGAHCVRLSNHRVHLDEQEEQTAAKLEKLFLEKRFSTPSRDEALEATAAAPAQKQSKRGVAAANDSAIAIFERLLERGVLVQVSPEIIFHREALEEARDMVQRAIERTGQLTAGDFKDLTGTSRKYAIPLLEHFDEIGLTVREGAGRILKP